jgi:hypothetical protein
MAKTVVGLFDDYNKAQMAVQQLRNAGIPDSDISLVAHNEAAGRTITTDTGHDAGDAAASGAGTGATIGAVAGGAAGLMAGLGAIVIPGFGPVVAAGWLVSTLTGAGLGAVAGAAIGGLAGALTAVGVPEEEAGYYAEGVRRGGALVTVRADDAQAERVADLLDNAGAVDIDERSEYYRSTGYAGYQPNTQPYSTEEIARERTAYQNYSAGIGARPRDLGRDMPADALPSAQTGGRSFDAIPDRRITTERAEDEGTGDRVSDRTGKRA